MPPETPVPGRSPHDIDLDAQATAAAGRDLADIGADLLRARHTIGANLDAAGAARPWGRDELGGAFTRRYEEAATETLDAWRATAEHLGAFGVQVGKATEDMLETDRMTSEVIDKAL